MSKFDFNAYNYTKDELLDFFFDSDELEDIDDDKIKNKANKLRKQAIYNNDIKLVNFINDVESIILKMSMDKDVPSGIEPFINNNFLNENKEDYKNMDTNYVFTKELMEGTLNPTYKQIITKLVNIDSQYKGIIEKSNANTTNYDFEFTETLTNVISVSLYSLEIPYSWYTFDESYGTNIFMIDDNVYKIPSGNYSPMSLIREINKVINVDISCELIASSQKVIFKNKLSKDVIIKFFSDTDAVFTNAKVNHNLGWLLGYRKEEIILGADIGGVAANSNVSGESPLDVWGPRYIFMLLDDFNNNQSSKGLIGITKADNNILPTTITEPVNRVLNGSNSRNISLKQNTTLKTIPNSILEAENLKNKDRNKKLQARYSSPVNSNYFAKIPIKITRNLSNTDNNYSSPLIEFSGQIQKNKREYFGPININKMKVTLLDDKGNILNINGLDWSFSLQTTHVYQYGTPESVSN